MWTATGLGQSGPGWVQPEEETAGVSTAEMSATVYEPPGTASSGGGGGPPPPPAPPILDAGNEADFITPEITMLAEGLLGDPVRIFGWVREHIGHRHYYGLRKGAALTLLEGCGNDADTSALLVALLRASGVPARYRCGFSIVPLTAGDGLDFEHWLGVDGTAAEVENLVLQRGTPAADFLRIVDGGGTPTGQYALRRVWVEADFGGGSYWLDASFKTITKQTGINLMAAAGMSRAGVVGSAGGTLSGAAVSGLSQTGLADHLRDRTTALLAHLGTNLPNATPVEVVGGQVAGAPPPDSFPLPYYNIGVESWESVPAVWFTTVRLATAGLDQTWRLAEWRGRRLSLVFDTAGKPQIYLDDTLAAQGSTGGTGMLNVSTWIDQPGGTRLDQNDAAEPKSYARKGSYALMYGCEAGTRWLQQRQQKLEAYKLAGLADDSREVKTETLNVVGLDWLRQTQMAGRLLADIADVSQLFHHRFGRVADEHDAGTGNGGHYVDVWMQVYGHARRHTGQEVASCFALDQFIGSAMEHGVLGRTQGGAQAASTVKLAAVANAQGKKLFLADSANWVTVQPQLTGYSTADAAAVSAAINAGKTLLLPEAGDLAVQSWTGAGYVTWKQFTGGAEAQMLISGGYHGGYSGMQMPVSTGSTILGEFYSSMYLNFTPVTQSVRTGGDPVDMASGQFVFSAVDLTLGDGLPPRGLTLSRHYHGGRRLRDETGLGLGWNHNLNIHATLRSEVDGALGGGTPAQMAAVVTGMKAGLDVFQQRAGARDWAVALLIADWIVERMLDNTVAVVLGDRVLDFHRQPDGTHTPPPGSTLGLSVDGQGRYVMQERHGNTHQFDEQGKILSVTDPQGRVQSFGYNGGRLVSVTDCYGRQFQFHYTGDRLTSVSDSTGRGAGYSYSGRLLALATDPELKNTSFVYDAENRLMEVRDHQERVLVRNVAFDAEGRVTLQHGENNPEKAWRYFYAPGQTIEENPLGGRITHLFDGKKRNTGVIDALGRHVTARHDGQDHAVEAQSPLLATRTAVYDRFHNVVESRDALDLPATAQYDAQQRVTASTDRNGKTTLVQDYNAWHQPRRVVDASGVVTETSYHTSGDGAGMPHTVTVDGELKATHTYTPHGELLRTTFPGGAYIEHTYNTRGDRISTRDARGELTSFTYNKRRQLLTTTLPGSQAADEASVLTLAYDDEGHVQAETSARGHTTTHTFSVQGKPLTTTLPGGALISRSYDLREWLTGSTDPTQRSTTRVLDAAGQVTAVVDALGNSVAGLYDADGRPFSASDPLGNTTLTLYNARGEALATVHPGHATTSDDYTYRTFDAEGRLVQLRNRRGKLWSFTHDDAGRPLSTTSPLGRVWTRLHDTQGRLSKITGPAGHSATLGYDARDRVVTRTLRDAAQNVTATLTHAYDANGNLISTTEGSSVLTRSYDRRNRVLSHTNAQAEQTGYRYDASGNLVQLIYPGNKTVSHAYDARERLTGITDWSGRHTALAWDAAGRLLQVTRANGSTRKLDYDAAGRLVMVTERRGNGDPIAITRWQLDAAGRPQRKLDLPPPHAASTWLPVLTASFNDDNAMVGQQGYGIPLDQDGNMLATYLPPRAGNGGALGVAELYWDGRGRLTDMLYVQPGDPVTHLQSHLYDAEGNRTHHIHDGATTRYTVNPHGLSGMSETLIEHRPDSTKRWCVWGGPAGLLYEVVTDSSGAETAVLHHHYDQAGNTVALSDTSGAVVARYEHTAYGVQTWQEGTATSAFLYSGAQGVVTDAETGLLHMRARYYHPWLARFVSEDPAQFGGGSNWYAYTQGDPLRHGDPSGLRESGYLGMVDWAQVGTSSPTGNLWASRSGWDSLVLPSDSLMAVNAAANAAYNASTQGHTRMMLEAVGWGLAFVEPTPLGEMAMAARTGGRVGATTNTFRGWLAWDAAAAPRNLNVYETIFEAPITGTTRGAHRASANRYLANQMSNDAGLAGMMNQELGTNVLSHMQSGRNLLNPPGTVWHHPIETPNVMRLLRVGEHTNPALQPVLHPGPNGIGGFGTFYGP